MRTENKNVHKAIQETNKNYVEVVNRVLELEKFIRDNGLEVPYVR